MGMIFGFTYEWINLDKYQPFHLGETLLRVLMSMLMQQTLWGELNSAVKLLTYLKRRKGLREHDKGRYINIVLISMQIITNISTFISLILVLG